MSSLLFISVGALIIAVGSLGVSMLLLWQSKARRNRESLTPEHFLAELTRSQEGITALTAKIEKLEAQIAKIYSALPRVVQKVGVIRFNPFHDMGSNQSFVVALLDGENSGVLLSSLYTRSETRLFAKPIVKGESEFELTNEERELLVRTSSSGTEVSTHSPREKQHTSVALGDPRE